MFLEREWEPPLEPPPRRRGMSAREERWLLRFIFVAAFVSLVAPIGGASIVQAITALFHAH